MTEKNDAPLYGEPIYPKDVGEYVLTIQENSAGEEAIKYSHRVIWDNGYFYDAGGHLWQKDRVPVFVQKLDPNYKELANANN